MPPVVASVTACATREAGPAPAGVSTCDVSGRSAGVSAYASPGSIDHPPTGRALGSPSHSTRAPPVGAA